MNISDTGIILRVRKYEERNGIATVLLREHGLYKGFVKNVLKHRSTFEIGNTVDFNWYARLPEHLGRFSSGDVLKQPASCCFHEPLKLLILQCVCELFASVSPEREPNEALYRLLENFLHEILMNHISENQLLHCYIQLEMALLAQLGFGLELDRCTLTNTTDDLAYVSPRTGKAVSRTAGEPYKTKLLPLPACLHDSSSSDTPQLSDALALTKHFLQQHVVLPKIRDCLMSTL